MLKRYSYLPVIMICLFTAGCSKDIDLRLEKAPSLFVIEGRISNLEGPYYIRVSKSFAGLHLGNGTLYGDTAEAVKDALVIISDDAGTRDTCIPAVSPMTRTMYTYDNHQLKSFTGPYRTDVFTADRGYYQTTKIKGVAGRTYHLQVQTGDSVFEASAYMAPVTRLDSAVKKETRVTQSGRIEYIPYAWFKEPTNETNHYLLQYNSIQYYTYDVTQEYFIPVAYFPYYVVDDQLLPPYVNGLPVRVATSGHDVYEGQYPVYFMRDEAVQVRLSSLTKEAYEYYRVLISQFESDGNVYKPVPASARGNIGGGALGLFYATEVSYKLILP